MIDIQIVHVDPIQVVMLRHQGSYEALSEKFEQLYEWAEKNGVPMQRTIGLYWDNPQFVVTAQLRSAACFEVPAGYVISGTNGLPVELGTVVGGDYVTTRFVGPYDKLEPIWSQLIDHTENQMRPTITDDPSVEIYLNDPSDTPPSQLITELYLPVR